ncbi:MAG: DUF4236 domain-containing protein [Pyrinomonadaceae bacterium]
MGFYFRKSVNFGIFRLNFSKSGIGVSAGVKGARISKTPKATYVHFGTNGFYYKQRINTSTKQTSKDNFNSNFTSATSESNESTQNSKESLRYVDSSNAEFLNKLNSTIQQSYSILVIQLITLITTFVGICFLINFGRIKLAVTDSTIAQNLVLLEFFINTGLFCLLLFLSWKAYKADKRKRTFPLFYQLWGSSLARFTSIKKACEILSKSSTVWRLKTFANDTNQPADVLKQTPPYILTDVETWSLESNRISLHFLPDFIFVWHGKKYGVVSYESFDVSFSTDSKLIRGIPPKDSTIVQYIYQHTRVNGLPDRRYKYNPAFPIVEYGLINFRSNTGWNIQFQVSNVSVAKTFTDVFNREVLDKQDTRKTVNETHQRTNYSQNRNSNYRQSYNQKQTKQTTPIVDETVRLAHEVLEIRVGATKEQIIAAYREQVKSYHPDKVVQTSPKIAKLAEEKMKEINLAYQTLKQHKLV